MNDCRYKASAPGKVILCGEYSVLEEWPALVLSVNRRLSLEIEPHNKNGLTLHPIGFKHSVITFPWGVSGIECEAESPLQMFAKIFNLIIAVSGARDKLCQQGWFMRCDSSALFDGENKLGLGSSAALTAAMAALLYEIVGEEIPAQEQLWLALQKVHSNAQGKRGSGADLAASIAGSLHRFVNQGDTYVEIEPRVLPDDLHIRFIWTGSSASTPAFLRSLSEWKKAHVSDYEEHMGALGFYSEEACAATDSSSFIAAIRDFTLALSTFDQAVNLGIFSDVHERLFKTATLFETVIYKPCGAGGGDLGIAISTDESALDAFVKKVSCENVRSVSLEMDVSGVRASRVEQSIM